jgi:hypothetical protein
MVGHERTGRLCPQHHFRDLYQKISWPAGSRNPRALWQDGHALQDKRRDWGPGEGNMALSGEDSPEGGLLFPEVRCLEFILENGLPVWRYQALDLVLEKRVLLSQAHRSTRMSFGRSVIVMKYWPKIMGCPNCGSIFMVNRDLSILPEKKTCVCRNQPAISDQSETRQPVKTSRCHFNTLRVPIMPNMRKTMKTIRKIKKSIFAIPAAAAETPPKPNSAAMIEIIRNMTAHFNIILSPFHRRRGLLVAPLCQNPVSPDEKWPTHALFLNVSV